VTRSYAALGLSRFSEWLLVRTRTGTFLLLVAAATFLRAGFSVGNATATGFDFARTFPVPSDDFASWGVIGPAIGAAIGVATPAQWVLLQLMSLAMATGTTAVLLWRRLRGVRWRSAVIWVSVSSMPAAQLHYLRSYDIWFLLGGSVVALGVGMPSAIIGGLVIGLSNAEAGVLALISLGAVLLAGRQVGWPGLVNGWLQRVGAALVSVILARVGLSLWFRAEGHVIETRAGLLSENLVLSLRRQLEFGGLGIFSWYGLAWVAVLVVLWGFSKDTRAVLLASIGLVLVGALATIVTMDGTRVFVAITWSAFLAALVAYLSREPLDSTDERILIEGAPLALLAGLLVPSVVTTPWGEIFLPFKYVVDRLF
jgi:hypothetical protein